MRQTIFTNYAKQAVLIIAGAAILTLLGLWTITCYDNKYIAKSAHTQDNFTQIPSKGYVSQMDGWTLYPDILLYPEDFASQASANHPFK